MKRLALHAKPAKMLLPKQDENCTPAPHTAQHPAQTSTKRSHSDRAPFGTHQRSQRSLERATRSKNRSERSSLRACCARTGAFPPRRWLDQALHSLPRSLPQYEDVPRSHNTAASSQRPHQRAQRIGRVSTSWNPNHSTSYPPEFKASWWCKTRHMLNPSRGTKPEPPEPERAQRTTIISLTDHVKPTSAAAKQRAPVPHQSLSLLTPWVGPRPEAVLVKNAHPTFMVQYCEKKGYACEELKAYVANRDTYLSDMMSANSISKDDAKAVVLSILNGGNSSFEKLTNKPSWLEAIN